MFYNTLCYPRNGVEYGHRRKEQGDLAVSSTMPMYILRGIYIVWEYLAPTQKIITPKRGERWGRQYLPNCPGLPKEYSKMLKGFWGVEYRERCLAESYRKWNQ